MVTKFTHIIGPVGSGKSRLATALAAQAETEGKSHLVIDEPGELSRLEVARLKTAIAERTPYMHRAPYQRAAAPVDLVIITHTPQPYTPLIAPGHQIIRLQQVLA